MKKWVGGKPDDSPANRFDRLVKLSLMTPRVLSINCYDWIPIRNIIAGEIRNEILYVYIDPYNVKI